MCIFSFVKEALHINICNLYPGLELTSPVYYSNGTTCHVSSNQKTDTNNIIEASFGVSYNQKDVKGALLYNLRRKYTTRTVKQFHRGDMPIENMATNIHLLVVWSVKDYCDNSFVCLIECPDDSIWDEDKLWILLHQYNEQFFRDYSCRTLIWLMHDNTVMKIRRKETYESDYKLNIFISEETGTYDMFKPVRIDPRRLVLSLLMLIILMYAVRLNIQPSFKLIIHNQCLNVGLVSPIYITGDGLECYRPPDYKAYVGDITRSGFIIKSDFRSYGVLIYRLQRRQSLEFTEIAKNAFWRIFESRVLYAYVALVEYAKEITWNEDNLNKFYYVNHDRLKECNEIILDTWLMDNMVLKMTFNARDLKGNPELSISISEEKKDSYTMRPFCINLKR
jgi:hypothetical protein